jgi:hypothetical protein
MRQCISAFKKFVNGYINEFGIALLSARLGSSDEVDVQDIQGP